MKTKSEILFAVRTVTGVLAGMAYGAVLLLQTGCIKDNRDGCEYTTNLYIVVDTETRADTDPVKRATLFLFDNDRTFLSSIEVSGEDIAGGVAIPVTYNPADPPTAIVWGNLGDAEQVSQPASSGTVDDIFVSMKRNADGYAVPSDSLFFGMKRLSGKPVEYVTISPKTGRINITVRGLGGNIRPESYYFTVDTPYDRYGFNGTPSAGDAVLKLPAALHNKDLVTTEACRMFHFPSPVPEGKAATVMLYETVGGPGNAQELASVDKDTDGEPIVILRGRTTNILIEFMDTGELRVTVVTTDWGEIVQWDGW